MDIKIHICLKNFYDTVASLNMKIHSIVDFESLMLDA